MIVDEDRVDVLTKYASKKGTGKKVESDHNLLVTEFDIQYSSFKSNERIEVFDFKNPDGTLVISIITLPSSPGEINLTLSKIPMVLWSSQLSPRLLALVRLIGLFQKS